MFHKDSILKKISIYINLLSLSYGAILMYTYYRK